ncbi:S8 family peptidase [Streptomyces sp. KR80]|uniref:S8 family peptidase n=1 Tax=Streptomyces sp. KR80 TaxID=3457426 RepID=UPI003FD15F19
MQRQLKRAGATTVAIAAAVAITAGLTAPSSVAEERTTARQATKFTGRTGPVAHWITLITGDRVAVDAKGKPVSIRHAKGREHIPVQIRRTSDHSYVVPRDAQQLIRQGRVDQRLFDVTTLSRPEYREAHRDGLRLIVTYRGAKPAAKADLRAAEDTDVRRTFPRINADAVQAGRQSSAAAWDALTREPRGAAGFRTAASGVDTVWLDAIHKAGLDKSVAQIGAPEAWKAGFDGKGTKIAVLDTGVDQTHPDLAGQEVAEKNFSASPDTKDRFGHGTHVASISAGTGAKSGGKYKGVASGAGLLDGKVLDDQGYGEDSGIIAGLEWAAAEGADIVNLSLGGPDSPGVDPLEEAVNRLSADTGTLFVIAAGNSGDLGPGTVGSPGSADAALTVGAVDKKDKLASFSSTGPRVGDGAVKPDLTAPGVDIGAAAAPGSIIAKEGKPVAPGYVAISGTSMATPHVAGAAAILAQQHPDWTGAHIKAALTGSTKPGTGYTAFQQGSGRVDVAKAIKQAVVAEPASVSFGTQLWPHTDDQPVTKKVTYRNLGTEPVTLDLTIQGTGPDGKPAPAGMFTSDTQQLTLQPKGEGTVSFTVDTKLGGTLDGAYSAAITATGGGHTVRTAAAVDREVESYDVTVKHLGRDGKPTKLYATLLDGIGGLGMGKIFFPYDESGTVKVRVPRGRYVLSSDIAVDAEEVSKGLDWINQPQLEVTKPTTVTVDARTAKPVDIKVPDSAAKAVFASPAFSVSTPDLTSGYGWWLDSYKGFRTAHLGPKPAAGELFQQFPGTWTKGGGTQYDLAYGGQVGRLATGYTQHAKKTDLAKLTVKLGASVKNRTGLLWPIALIPGSNSGSAISPTVKLPSSRTLYVNGAGVQWALDFAQVGGEDFEAVYSIGPKTYQPRKSYEKVFNVGVFGPKVTKQLGIGRKGNTIEGRLPVHADGKGHLGGSLYDKATTTLYRNGVKVGSVDDALDERSAFTVPAGKAAYKLTTSVTRSKVASVTTRLTASWTFSSKKTSEPTRLPASTVRFSPALAADSTAKAGAMARIPVTVEGSAAGRNLKSLAVYVSYDGGKHWKKVKVAGGKVTVKNPKAGKGISLRATVTDKQGNTHTQSLYNAYLGK